MTEPKTINVKDLTDHLKKSDRVPYGFFVSRDVWDSLKKRVPSGTGVWGSPIMIDPGLDRERFDIAFTRESFDKRANEIRSNNS